MTDRDLASDLEFWSGRGRASTAADDPERPLRSFRRSSAWRTLVDRAWSRRPSFAPLSELLARRGGGPRPGGRVRPIAAAALLAGLTAAWLIVGHHSNAAVATPEVDAVVTTSPSTTPTSTTALRSSSSTASPTTMPEVRDCRGLAPARPRVRCAIDGIAVDEQLLTSATVAAAYRHAADADVAARTGPPACARGVPDERAWSLATAPRRAVGRYRCRFEQARAAMWWTQGDRLVHAVARDADLAGLFSWWRAHPLE